METAAAALVRKGRVVGRWMENAPQKRPDTNKDVTTSRFMMLCPAQVALGLKKVACFLRHLFQYSFLLARFSPKQSIIATGLMVYCQVTYVDYLKPQEPEDVTSGDMGCVQSGGYAVKPLSLMYTG